MTNYLFTILFTFLTPAYAFSQEVEVIKYEHLEEIIKNGDADIQVINFWATWCRPCIQEIPYFEALANKYDTQQVKVLLVSLDFVEELESKVLPFVRKRSLRSEVKLLDETDFNSIINDIDTSWSGAIPATLVINNQTGESQFYEKMFKEGELELLIEGQLEE